MAKRKIAEPISGTYAAIPHAVLDSVAFRGASHYARSLLRDLIRQLNGRNNGHLHLARSWLRDRGWMSVDTIQNSRDQLIERGLIHPTKLGGLNAGASQYAVTWLAISDYAGLHVTPQSYQPGAWRLMDGSPIVMTRGLRAVARPPKSRRPDRHTDLARPPGGRVERVSAGCAGPPGGHNVCNHTPVCWPTDPGDSTDSELL